MFSRYFQNNQRQRHDSYLIQLNFLSGTRFLSHYLRSCFFVFFLYMHSRKHGQLRCQIACIFVTCLYVCPFSIIVFMATNEFDIIAIYKICQVAISTSYNAFPFQWIPWWLNWLENNLKFLPIYLFWST